MDSNWLTIFFKVFLPGSLTWYGKNGGREIYLTFDDAPTGPFTREILEILDHFDAKATFFCVGDNVVKFPAEYDEIIRRGHMVGNHTYNHLKGWKTPADEYTRNVRKASEVISSKLFRPPYGKITYGQIKRLEKEFRIIMWSLLSMDYHPQITPEKCLQITVNGLHQGAIVVFHDNIKAEEKVRYALPRFLEEAKRRGYRFSLFS